MMQDKVRPASTEGQEESSLIERAAERLSASRERTETTAGGSGGDRARPPGGRSLTIDFDHLEEVGQLSPRQMRSQLAEETRLVKRSVVQSFWHREVERANLVMVTSAMPGEGKSFTALNLAISLACEVDFHVLLVDADFARPAIFKRIGCTPPDGLMDLLKDPSRDLGEVIYRTNIERLSIVGPGQPDEMSSELLGSQRMLKLAEEVAERYPDRLIIFDSPPLLASSEPAVLAQYMGQILFVIEADSTRRELIETALERLPEGAEIKLILNKGRARLGVGQYPYYGYRSVQPEPGES